MKILLTFLILTGAALAQDATLTLVNDSSGGGWNFRPPTIKVLDDGRELAKVENHKPVTMSLAPGLHGLALSFKKKEVTVLRAEPGKAYVVLVYLHQEAWGSRQGVRVLTGDEAKYYLGQRQ